MLWNWFIWDNAFSVVFNAVYLIVILTTVFVVILDNRNPVRTMAWILFLFFLPLLGLVFYFFFGAEALFPFDIIIISNFSFLYNSKVA